MDKIWKIGWLMVLTIITLSGAIGASNVAASDTNYEYVPGELIIKFKNPVSP